MSELRQDPIHRRWVIIAPERQRRPRMQSAEARPGPAIDNQPCPFCPGNEALTPPEICARRPAGSQPDTPDWSLRVVPNRSPALRVEGRLEPRAVGLHDLMQGIGAHEVLIEMPEHGPSMADMSVEALHDLLEVWQERQRDLFRDGRLEHVLIFKNHGAAAGALLSHSCSQIIATPVTPRTVMDKLTSARRYYDQKRRCVFCDMLRQELDDGARVVLADEQVAVLAPYASRFPFELLIMPRRHRHAFVDSGTEELGALAMALREALGRLREALDDPPYNLVLHTAPNPTTLRPHPFGWRSLPWDYHWHIEIIPRQLPMAGFEWASGFHINPTPPEEAAEFLRGLGRG